MRQIKNRRWPSVLLGPAVLRWGLPRAFAEFLSRLHVVELQLVVPLPESVQSPLLFRRHVATSHTPDPLSASLPILCLLEHRIVPKCDMSQSGLKHSIV